VAKHFSEMIPSIIPPRIFSAIWLGALALFAGGASSRPAAAEPPKKPPVDVLRIGIRQAAKRHDLAQRLPDVHAYPPKLAGAQRVVGYPRSGQAAWMLHYTVAEVGPRALTPLSQIVIVAEARPQLLLALPQDGEDPEDPSPAGEAQGCRMVELSPGRFALAIEWGRQRKIPGHLSIFALERQGPPRELWTFPEEGMRSVASTIHYVKLDGDETFSLAIRQLEEVFEGDRAKIVPHEFLYRLDPKADRYRRADIEPAHLKRIIDAAKRDPRSPVSEQRGTAGFDTHLSQLEDAAKLDRALNAVYTSVAMKLSPAENDTMKAEELLWLRERDAIKNDWERMQFVEKRIKVLEQRLSKIQTGRTKP
jgi:hypothetical protein